MILYIYIHTQNKNHFLHLNVLGDLVYLLQRLVYTCLLGKQQRTLPGVLCNTLPSLIRDMLKEEPQAISKAYLPSSEEEEEEDEDELLPLVVL